MSNRRDQDESPEQYDAERDARPRRDARDTDRVVERTEAPADETAETGFDVEGFRPSLVGQRPDPVRGPESSSEPAD